MKGTTSTRLAALGLSIAVVLLTLGGINTQAADTDIYLFTETDPQDEPLVMFSLDWRPNLNATAGGCTSLSEAACPDFWQLKEDGFLDVAAGSKVRNIDYYIAVLDKVFDALGTDVGLKVGLMVSHDATNCDGPQTGTNKCTNGGFIAMGFKSVKDGGSEELLEKLEAISKMNQTERFRHPVRAIPIRVRSCSSNFSAISSAAKFTTAITAGTASTMAEVSSILRRPTRPSRSIRSIWTTRIAAVAVNPAAVRRPAASMTWG
ncbi:MAG: hypothetical protein R3F37_04030 [Candidatus Competibacteraceae bacterium]